MLFNSIEFLVFFCAVLGLHFSVPHSIRWIVLLVASCGFYMAFVPVYILILGATILIDYWAAIGIERSASPRVRRGYLFASIVAVCAILFWFKYYNFFNSSAAAIAGFFNLRYNAKLLEIVLPIGLSFHTFQSLSYVIEVFRGRQAAERHFGYYALYVMYFPQLVAGPIERPQNLLHQFRERRDFDWGRFYDGMCLCLVGLFKKVVVADTLGGYVDLVYAHPDSRTGADLLLGTYFFAVQIYNDFSGYSDIARGVSRIMGIELMRNFDTPYFSAGIGEFWSRWHISLSTWFRDYVYIPMGGSRVSRSREYFNIFFVFLLSGIWHGANWTFVIWGALHGVFLTVERAIVAASGDWMKRRNWLSQMLCGLLVFNLVVAAWVFFRANSVDDALTIVSLILWDRSPLRCPLLLQYLTILGLFLAVELSTRWQAAADWKASPIGWFRLGYPLALLFCILLLGVERGAQFIYFQF